MVAEVGTAAPVPSSRRRLSIQPLACLILTLALGGCLDTDNKPKLSVVETPPPDLRGAKDIDDAMLARIARAVEQPEAGGASESRYRQLAQEQPGAASPRIGLAQALKQKRDFDGARTALREALALEPRNVDAWVELAQVELAQEKPAEAMATLDKALAAAPGELRLLNAKGVVLDRSGQHKQAQALYRQALLGQPKNQMVRHNLGRSLALDGHAQEAIAILRPLAREPDAPPSTRQSLALAIERQHAPGT